MQKQYNLVMVTLQNISFKYKKRSKDWSLNNVTFNIYDGTFHAFIGENGAGKSTTMKVITGLVNNYEGSLIINEKDPLSDNNARLNMAYIPDKAIFPNNLNAFNYLYRMAILTRPDYAEVKREIQYWTERLGISDKLKANPNLLSAGQKKKILLIKCIIERARIIVLDEPAANLDPSTRIELFNVLKYLADQGITIFISTHIIEEIKKYANYATFIKGGQILWSGPVMEDQIIQYYEYMFSKKNEESNEGQEQQG